METKRRSSDYEEWRYFRPLHEIAFVKINNETEGTLTVGDLACNTRFYVFSWCVYKGEKCVSEDQVLLHNYPTCRTLLINNLLALVPDNFPKHNRTSVHRNWSSE